MVGGSNRGGGPVLSATVVHVVTTHRGHSDGIPGQSRPANWCSCRARGHRRALRLAPGGVGRRGRGGDRLARWRVLCRSGPAVLKCARSANQPTPPISTSVTSRIRWPSPWPKLAWRAKRVISGCFLQFLYRGASTTVTSATHLLAMAATMA